MTILIDQPPRTEEQLITDAVLRVIENRDVELSISALVKVIQALLIGVSVDQGQAYKYAGKIALHLRKEIKQVDQKQFGFLKPVDNGPIRYKGQ